jgi:hypothetical protein
MPHYMPINKGTFHTNKTLLRDPVFLKKIIAYTGQVLLQGQIAMTCSYEPLRPHKGFPPSTPSTRNPFFTPK